MRLFPLFNSILRTALDADGKKIVNLGTPTQDADAANKKYVDEHGGGGSVTIDDTVTRTSANPVKSSGIWSAIWGALTALPAGFSSLYDWCVAKFAEKRDKTDLNVYGFTDWDVEFVGVQPPTGFVEAVRREAMPDWEPHEDDIGGWFIPDVQWEDELFYTTHACWQPDEDGTLTRIEAGFTNNDDINYDCVFSRRASSTVVDKIAKKSEVDDKQDKITASGILKGDGQGGVTQAMKSSTAQDPANADYRDPQDNTCHKSEGFGLWTFDNGTVANPQPYLYTGVSETYWLWQKPDDDEWAADGDESSTELTFIDDDHTHMTRSAVCTNGEKFMTPSRVFGTDGKPTDTFATDLLGKPVAINSLHYALYSVPTTGADANKLKDRAVNAFTFSGGSLPTFPAQVTGYARDFLLNVTATADGSNITIPEPDGSTATSIGDALAFTAGNTYLVAITEIAAKHYYIRVIDTTPANAD